MSKRTTEQLFDALHGELTESMRAELQRYKDSGEAAPPALLSSIARFLKDNGIDRPAKTNDELDLLNKELPDFNEEGLENVTPLKEGII